MIARIASRISGVRRPADPRRSSAPETCFAAAKAAGVPAAVSAPRAFAREVVDVDAVDADLASGLGFAHDLVATR